MTKPLILAWDDTPEFFEKLAHAIETHGNVCATVTPEQLAESNRAIEAGRKAAAKERRAQKKAKTD